MSGSSSISHVVTSLKYQNVKHFPTAMKMLFSVVFRLFSLDFPWLRFHFSISFHFSTPEFCRSSGVPNKRRICGRKRLSHDNALHCNGVLMSMECVGSSLTRPSFEWPLHRLFISSRAHANFLVLITRYDRAISVSFLLFLLRFYIFPFDT